MKKIVSTYLLMMCSLTSFSQDLKFTNYYDYVVPKSAIGRAFEVQSQHVSVAIYKHEVIDNPEYLVRTKKIDSLNNQINELQNKNFGGGLKNALGVPLKKNKKELEIDELRQQINLLKKDTYYEGTYNTYRSGTPKQIYAYVPVGDTIRDILIIDSTKNIAEQLIGNVFIEEMNTERGIKNIYRLLNQDTLLFKKNELVTEDFIQKYFDRDAIGEISVEFGYLYKRESDGAIFLFDKDFKKNVVEKSKYEFSKLLDDLGISVEKREGYNGYLLAKLTKDGKTCVLTSEVMEYLEKNKNADVIVKVNNSIAQYKIYLNQQCDITAKMAKYIQMRSSLMKLTPAQRAEWTQYTKSAMAIQEKMRKLPFSNEMSSQLDYKENQLHSANIDIISYSKQVLGL